MAIALTGSKVPVSRQRRFTLKLSNRNPFRVTGTVSLRSAKALALELGSGKKKVRMGRKRIAIAARGRTTVTIRLSRRVFALLTRLGRIPARATIVTVAAGRPALSTERRIVLIAPNG